MGASIKGSAFQSVQADVQRLVDRGDIDLEEISAELSEKDRGFLDSFITPVSWMPIATYGRLLDLLVRAEGGDDPIEYLRGRGRLAARRLLGGAYQGFARGTSGLDLKGVQIVIGVARMLYDFMHWEARELGGGAIEIRVQDAKAYPDNALHTAEGFLEFYAELSGAPRPRISSDRPTPNEIRILVQPA
jgi:hypothetical protein